MYSISNAILAPPVALGIGWVGLTYRKATSKAAFGIKSSK